MSDVLQEVQDGRHACLPSELASQLSVCGVRHGKSRLTSLSFHELISYAHMSYRVISKVLGQLLGTVQMKGIRGRGLDVSTVPLCNRG